METPTVNSVGAAQDTPRSAQSADLHPHKRRKPLSKQEDGNLSPKNDKPKSKKIPTYYRRKNELDALEEERKQLEMQLEQLAKRAEVLRPQETLKKRQSVNDLLRDTLHSQRVAFATAGSIISQHMREKSTGPFDVPTRLSKDPVERTAALLDMRKQRLKSAYDFMMGLQRYLDVTLDYLDQKKYVAVNGDICSERFEIVPLPEAQSVKPVFDAVETFVSGMEITMSEVMGDLTVRENDDPVGTVDSPVAQHRFVSNIANSVQMDTNTAAFAEYWPVGPPDSGVDEVGFSINDTIDEDELYPYRPNERVRQDVTVIIMVARHRRENGEPLVVFSRWWSMRLRRSHIHVPKFVAERIRDGLDAVSAAMLTAAERAARSTYK
ncbi:hypothetical protein PHYBOEH_009216 [Phytophthora boehmeriae]|uniref:Uncharacterized protein n=1 Tax=Phytophthora boehmeriae TaxID=109152 RepID=A0A8T1X6W3_9STRA|nr:hypothetical protein PHYBOEH_009216 [Phytophthora boehmeriae]